MREFHQSSKFALAIAWSLLGGTALIAGHWLFAVAAIAAAAANAEAYYLRRRLARIPRDCACEPGQCQGRIGERCVMSGFVVDRDIGGEP